MTAATEASPRPFRTNYIDTDKQGLCSWGNRESAVEYAQRIARKRGEAARVANVDTGEVWRVTSTGRVIDGHSVAVGEAKKPYHYKTEAGFSATNQHRVNRARVLVEGSRCRVKGIRGTEFVFVRLVKNGDREWAEVREVERDDEGLEHITRFRAFRPERLRTSRGWN